MEEEPSGQDRIANWRRSLYRKKLYCDSVWETRVSLIFACRFFSYYQISTCHAWKLISWLPEEEKFALLKWNLGNGCCIYLWINLLPNLAKFLGKNSFCLIGMWWQKMELLFFHFIWHYCFRLMIFQNKNWLTKPSSEFYRYFLKNTKFLFLTIN